MEPKIVDRGAFTVMGVLAHGAPDKMDFNDVWANRFMPHNDQVVPFSTDKAYYGLWFASDEKDGAPDYVAGMAVENVSSVPEGLVLRQVPAARYAMFECTMKTIGETYGYAYQRWLPASPYEPSQGPT
jgi:predicted transcriptional regulator YdeE